MGRLPYLPACWLRRRQFPGQCLWSQPYADNPLTRYLLHRVGGRWLRSGLPIALLDPIGGVPYYEIVRVPHSDTMLVAGSPLRSPEGVVLALGRL